MSAANREPAPAPGCGRAAPAQKSPFRHLWVVGIVVYLAVVWYVGWRRIGSALASLDPIALGAMAATMLLSLLVRVVKWRLVIGPGKQACTAFFLAKAGGDWSPGRVGELAPLMLRQFRSPRMGAWIITDRLLEMAATLGLGALGVMAMGLHDKAPETRMDNLLIYTAVALVVLVAVPATILTQRGLFVSIAQWSHGRGFTRLGSLGRLFADVALEARAFGAKVPMASALTVLATSLDIVVGMLLYRSFGFRVPFILLAVAQCAHALASAFPFTPNATGVPYLAAAVFLNNAAGLPNDVLATSVLVSLAMTNAVFWSAFGVGMRGFRRRTSRPADQGRVFDYLASGEMLYSYEPDSLRRLNALVPRKGRLLDIGCGDGAIARALDADIVVGLEISPRCAALARRSGVAALVGDARNALPLASESFDTVYCIDVLHHLPPTCWEALISELYRVLRPGGRLAIVEPDARYAFVRLTQSPTSLIRVAPCADEPAINPDELQPLAEKPGFEPRLVERREIRIDGSQICRSVFPMWQRLLKAPFVIALAAWHGARPNKFVLLATKTTGSGAED